MTTTTVSVQSEIRRARVFLGFLREAEGVADQIRLHSLGVIWTPDRTSAERTNLLQRFDGLQRYYRLGPG